MHKRTILLKTIPGYEHHIGYKPYHFVTHSSRDIEVVEPYAVEIETETPLDQPPTVDDVVQAVRITAEKTSAMVDRLVVVKAELAASGQLTKEIMAEYLAATVTLS